MKKHSYGKLISMSWNRTREILFRPFSLKKWIMLYIVILLAGQMGGGFNMNLQGNRADFDKMIETITTVRAPVQTQTQVNPQLPDFFKDPQTVAIISLIACVVLLFIGIFMLLWMWIRANFAFVFIDSVVRNDASLRIPYHRNKAQGRSYFWWNIVLSSIAILVFGGIIALPIFQLIKAGIFKAPSPNDAIQMLSVVLRYLPILLVTGIFFFMISFFTSNFALPIMYKRKIGTMKAWGIFLGLMKKNMGEILLYLLVKIGLFILALIAMIILVIVGLIALLIIGGLIGLLGWLIFSITPGAAKPIVIILLALIGIPIFIFLIFLFSLIFLPIPVFFRGFSLHVLGSIDESLDLFAPKTPEEIAAEGDDTKYKKSMRLVWFTVLAPAVIAVMALLFAIGIPNFIKARSKALQMRRPDIEKVIPLPEKPTAPETPAKIDIPREKTVTVYLKNGNSFKAEIEKESEHNVAFKIEGGTFMLPRSDILRIER